MNAFSEDAKRRSLPEPEILHKEKQRLTELAKKVAVGYSWILVCFIHQRKARKDHVFFEVLVCATEFPVDNARAVPESAAARL